MATRAPAQAASVSFASWLTHQTSRAGRQLADVGPQRKPRDAAVGENRRADLERAAKFYSEVLGWKAAPSPPEIRFFDMGGIVFSIYRHQDLAKDRDALLAFYDFPAEHWDHLRTTNPIESVFATVRHRTVRTKGSLSSTTARLMVFKLVIAASKTWRRLKGTNQLPKLIAGVRFNDGIEVIQAVRARFGDELPAILITGDTDPNLLRSMAPTTFDDVGALIALYRPGPMSANMHYDYADRKNNRQPVSYFHPDAEALLADTYGLMIYQESVMRVAQKFAGYSLAEADSLRKAMGKKSREVMAKAQEFDAKNPAYAILPRMSAVMQQRAKARELSSAAGGGTRDALGVPTENVSAFDAPPLTRVEADARRSRRLTVRVARPAPMTSP